MQQPAHGAPTKLTRISYVYRGISGISEKREIELAGRITAKQREALFDATRGERRLFIPEQVGLEHLGPYTDWDFPTEGDHCWHELTAVEVLPHMFRSVDPTVTPWEPLNPFIDKFVAAGREGWDDVTFGTETLSQQELARRGDAPKAGEASNNADARDVAPETLERLASEVFDTREPGQAPEGDLGRPESNRVGF
jgi:hypothetical protein